MLQGLASWWGTFVPSGGRHHSRTNIADGSARLEDFQTGVCAADQQVVAAIANPCSPSYSNTLIAGEPLR